MLHLSTQTESLKKILYYSSVFCSNSNFVHYASYGFSDYRLKIMIVIFTVSYNHAYEVSLLYFSSFQFWTRLLSVLCAY